MAQTFRSHPGDVPHLAIVLKRQISNMQGTFASIDSPVLTGDPQAPTPPTGDNDTSIATTAFVKNQNYAPLASPSFTGDPHAPTPAPGDNDTSVATTAFVKNQNYATTIQLTGYLALTGGNLTGQLISQWAATGGNVVNQIVNSGTGSTAGTEAGLEVVLGSIANAYGLLDILGGASPQMRLVSGAGAIGGLAMTTGAGHISMMPSGNVGIGIAAPGVKLTVIDTTQYGGIQLRNASNVVATFQPQGAGGDNGALILLNGGTANTVISAAGNSYIIGGNLGIGTTAPSKRLSVSTPAAADFVADFNNTHAAAGDSVIRIAGGAAGSDTTTALLTFYNSAISAWIGGIQRNGASTVAFLTTSDERLKEGIAATKTGLDALMKIKVRDYSYKDDERVEQGILAQELHAIYPIAVHPGGDDPALQPWAIDYGRLTPLLIKVVQELKVEIDILKRKGSS
jgi:hypothetical protein